MSGMNAKQINKTISKKIEEWLTTLPEDLRERAASNAIVTGGSICSMLLGEKVNDYDIYFKDPTVALDVAKHYVAMTNGVLTHAVIRDGIVDICSSGIRDGWFVEWKNLLPTVPAYHPQYISTHAITLSDDVQLITKFTGDLESIHKNFDFVHTLNYWTSKTGVVLNMKSLECILSKKLIYSGSTYPICSMFRMRKFIKRGWSISAGEMFKIAWEINKLDLADADKLRSQLIGVDVAYFNSIINTIDKHRETNGYIDTEWLFNVIDHAFEEDVTSD